MIPNPAFAVRRLSFRSMSRAALVALLPVAAGCTSLQSVSVTQIPGDRSRPVRAEVSNTALFGIHFDNDFLEDLTPQLFAQCPHGRITGLLTKQENSVYVIVSTRRVIATGYCVFDAPATAATPPVPGPPAGPAAPPPPVSPAAPADGPTTHFLPPAPAIEEHGS
jgi:hypothetical protein